MSEKIAEMPEMTITSIAPWFGSKRSLAEEIVEELGPHDGYFELFAGSCAVLMNKPTTSVETINDMHGDLINLARVLASNWWEWLYQEAGRMLQCEPLFEEIRQKLNAEPVPVWAHSRANAERALLYVVSSWMGRSGSGGCNPASANRLAVRWTAKGGNSAVRWRAVVQSLPAWHERLHRVSILQRDAFECAEQISNEPGMAVYADPPYLLSTRSNGGGSRYLHDFDENPIPEDEAERIGIPEHLRQYGDHARLAVRLWRLDKARVVVSYYEHPALSELYPGWTKRDVARGKNLSLSTIKGSKQTEAPEVLMINGPSLVIGRGKRLFD